MSSRLVSLAFRVLKGNDETLSRRRTLMVDIPQQIPSQVRELAEKNFEQAREAFLGFIGAAQKATGAADALPLGAKDAVAKAITFAENNVNAAFDLAQKLLHAKDIQEIFALQTDYAKAQLAAIQTQAKELGAAAQDAIASATKK
jgi:phasin